MHRKLTNITIKETSYWVKLRTLFSLSIFHDDRKQFREEIHRRSRGDENQISIRFSWILWYKKYRWYHASIVVQVVFKISTPFTLNTVMIMISFYQKFTCQWVGNVTIQDIMIYSDRQYGAGTNCVLNYAVVYIISHERTVVKFCDKKKTRNIMQMIQLEIIMTTPMECRSSTHNSNDRLWEKW